MYGSSLRRVTLMPRDSRIAAREAAAIPFPREETTPPETNTYLAITNQGDGMENGTRKRAAALARELRPVPEKLERLGVGERLDVPDRAAVHNVAHRELDDLVRLGAGNVGYLQHLRRHVPRRGVLAYSRLDSLDEGFVQQQAVAQLHEQHHADIADLTGGPGLADDDRLHHLVQLLHLAVDLRGSDSHAAGIEHGVGAAVDDHPAVGGDLAPIAVRPHSGKPLEVGGAVLRAIGVVPEPQRKRGEGPRADQLASLALDRPALLVEYLDLDTESAALDLATPHGQDRAPQHEAAADVGPAGDRGQANVALDRAIDEIEALR